MSINCETIGLDPCFCCRITLYGISVCQCQVSFFKDMLISYGRTEEDAKKYFAEVLQNKFGLSILGPEQSPYLRKAVELYYDQFINVFDTISMLL